MRHRLIIINFLIVFALLFANYNVSASEILDSSNISAQSSVLIDQDSGKVLYEKNKDQRMYPASTTKCMTALIVLENCPMDDMVIVGNEMDLNSADGSKAGLKKGELISVKDLLMGLMLPSGNDAAYTVAVHTARKVSNNENLSIDDSLRQFVNMMNKRAAELGADGTNFVNVDGYHDDNHYTTAGDLALIVSDAMKNSIFREIVSTAEYKSENKVTSNNSMKNIVHNWTNKNELILKGNKNYLNQVTGVKTGSTTPAGYCLAASASENGMNLISIVLKSSTDAYRWKDSKSLINYGLENFQKYKICSKDDIIASTKAAKLKIGKKVILNAIADSDVALVLKNMDINKIQKSVVWDEKNILINGSEEKSVVLRAPITKDTHIGTVIYTLNGDVIAKAELLAQNDAMHKNFFDVFIFLIDVPNLYYVCGIFVFAILVLAAKTKRRKVFVEEDEEEM